MSEYVDDLIAIIDLPLSYKEYPETDIFIVITSKFIVIIGFICLTIDAVILDSHGITVNKKFVYSLDNGFIFYIHKIATTDDRLTYIPLNRFIECDKGKLYIRNKYYNFICMRIDGKSDAKKYLTYLHKFTPIYVIHDTVKDIYNIYIFYTKDSKLLNNIEKIYYKLPENVRGDVILRYLYKISVD